MSMKHFRFLLCLTGTVFLTAGVIFLPRYFSRSLDLRNLNQVETSGREDFSFLEQGANDIYSAFHAFAALNTEDGTPVLLASVEEPVQMNSEMISEVYIQAMTASEVQMLPWLRYLYDHSSAETDAGMVADRTDEEEVWLDWSNYIRSAQYYSLTCTSEENPRKKELLNFWYLRFSDLQTFDYYFIVNAVNYQIYYAQIHNDITEAIIREYEEYQKVSEENPEEDVFISYLGESFGQGCMQYYESQGWDVVNQENLYQKMNVAILYLEGKKPFYIERSIAEGQNSTGYKGICVGFQDLIRWVRQLQNT